MIENALPSHRNNYSVVTKTPIWLANQPRQLLWAKVQKGIWNLQLGFIEENFVKLINGCKLKL